MARHRLYPESVRPGFPKVGPLPAAWRTVPFGDLLRPVLRPADLDDDATYQLVTAKRSRGGIVPREKLRGDEIKTKTQFYVQGGDFLISRRQIIHGACGFVPDDLSGAVVSGEYDVLTVQPALLPEYLEAFTHTTCFQQSCFQSSVGVDVEKMVFDLDHWFTYTMPVPPPTEQRRIADALGSIRVALSANDRALAHALRVKKALLQRLLTEGIGHTRFKDTEIGRVPEGWEVVPLSEVGDWYSGGTPNRSTAEFWGGDIPWVAASGLYDFDVTTSEHLLTRQGAAQVRLVPEGTVLFVVRGMSLATEFRVAIARRPVCFNQDLKAIVSRRLLPDLLAYHLQNQGSAVLRMVDNASHGTCKLDTPRIAGLGVPVPPAAEQRAIVRAVQAIDANQAAVVAGVERLRGVLSAARRTLLTGTT